MSVESRISPFIRPALLITVATGAFGIAITAGTILTLGTWQWRWEF